MSSPEIPKINLFHGDKLEFPPSRMATDIRIPEEAIYASMIAVPPPEKMSPEEMERNDAYCLRVQKQLEEDHRLGRRKRELIY